MIAVWSLFVRNSHTEIRSCSLRNFLTDTITGILTKFVPAKKKMTKWNIKNILTHTVEIFCRNGFKACRLMRRLAISVKYFQKKELEMAWLKTSKTKEKSM